MNREVVENFFRWTNYIFRFLNAKVGFFGGTGCLLACVAGVFFGRANVFARESAMLKIKDGGYNNTNMNKVSPTQNKPALQASYFPLP